MARGKRFNPYGMFTGIFIADGLARFTGIGAAAKLIYGRLVGHAGRDGKVFPSQETLAEETGLAIRTVRTALTELEQAEFIEVARPDGADRLAHRTARYFFNFHGCFGAVIPDRQNSPVRSGKDGTPGEADSAGPLEDIQGKTTSLPDGREGTRARPADLDAVREFWKTGKRDGARLDGDPEAFFDHHERDGWKVKGRPIKDWRAGARTWSRMEARFGAGRQNGDGFLRRRPGRAPFTPGRYDNMTTRVIDNRTGEETELTKGES